jgi:hypothetical protein
MVIIHTYMDMSQGNQCTPILSKQNIKKKKQRAGGQNRSCLECVWRGGGGVVPVGGSLDFYFQSLV